MPGARFPVDVMVRLHGVQRRVPDSFLGFSVEWPELPVYEADTPAFARVIGLLSVAGQPVPLRLGGETADSTYWGDAAEQLPPKAYVLNRGYFTWLGGLARMVPVSLLLDLNLAARSPSMARALGRELRATLPRPSVTGFEIGNEPDLYVIGLVGTQDIQPSADSPFRWALSYGPYRYAADFARYARAVGAVWPHVRYAGPAQASYRTDFVRRILRTRSLSLLTLHRYQFDACPGPGSATYPSQQSYLSAVASRAFAAKSRWFVSTARRAGVPLRVTEFGSAICGVSGLTNTYATTLWGANTIFNLLAQGFDGVNVHLRSRYLNSAVNASRTGGLTVEPFYYGMLLVTRTLGPGARLMRVFMSHAPANVSVWAVRDRYQTMRVLLLNSSQQDILAKLSLGSSEPGSVQRVTAPSPTATTGVRFAGQALDRIGQWNGTQQVVGIRAHDGILPVSVPHDSAALLTVRR